MLNPAFIVDGHTEQRFISCICPGQPVRRTNLNGNSVTIEAIAKKIASLIRLLGNRYYPIIVIVDKEDRTQTFEELINELRERIFEHGLNDQDIRIGFADRMIENWIVADFEKIGRMEDKPPQTDGLNGASLIKKHKGSYDKVIDGVALLLTVNRSVVYQESPSYRHFIDRLHGVECDYLNFNRG